MSRVAQRPNFTRSIGLLVIAAFCGGCQSLSGTTWVVTDIRVKADEDLAEAQDVRAVVVEFRPGGRLRTTVQDKSDNIESEEDETYELLGDTILVRHPSYEKRLKFKRDGATLLISSDRFDLTLKKYVRPVEKRPAMFRPSSLGRRPQEFRRLSTMSSSLRR